MIFHSYNGDGAIYEPAPIYAYQLIGYDRDSRRVLLLHRIRRALRLGLPTPGNVTMWSVLLATAAAIAIVPGGAFT